MHEVQAKRATLVAAQAMLMFFSVTFYPRGWMASVHGSSVEAGSGRDIDIVLNALETESDEDEVIDILNNVGMDIIVDEQRGRFRGLVGLFHGFIVDVTLAR